MGFIPFWWKLTITFPLNEAVFKLKSVLRSLVSCFVLKHNIMNHCVFLMELNKPIIHSCFSNYVILLLPLFVLENQWLAII